ncbi:GNAT family N-acetyltransferase [Ruania zhangjianzhongii]|uniref:GNAT family N-acetyltransferase n=1 Tax=Ruania zhangjianzhongii TaxID=2603206 RepID=UPI0011C7B9EB|nr:GNAT family protein [Ruania zhangjianzhongii]
MTVTIRPAQESDAEDLSALVTRNRAYFSTGEPELPDEYYLPAFQARAIYQDQVNRAAGTGAMFLIEEDSQLVGRINLNSIVRGVLQSGNVGYLVDEASTGRGIATAALRHLVDYAFTDLRLHRLQASVLPENAGSQKVLKNLGFSHFGTAPEYLFIQGRWRTHDLFQLINRAYGN